VGYTIVLVDAGQPRWAQQESSPFDMGGQVSEAFNRAGVPWERCYHEERSRLVFMLVPPEYSRRVVTEVPGALRDPSRSTPDFRLAVYVEDKDATHAVTATAVDTTFRLLESSSVDQVLAESPAAVAVIFPERFAEDFAIDSKTPARRVRMDTSTGPIDALILLFGERQRATAESTRNANPEADSEKPRSTGNIKQTGTGVLIANTGSVNGNITITHHQ
jgi:hypothetical protein